jgi:hypothetical protein
MPGSRTGYAAALLGCCARPRFRQGVVRQAWRARRNSTSAAAWRWTTGGAVRSSTGPPTGAGSPRPGETLRIEPGRSVTAYCGWYVTRVLDVKRSHGKAFGVLAGGTHQLRTPAAKGHNRPFAVLR